MDTKTIKERILNPTPEELRKQRSDELMHRLDRLDYIFNTPKKTIDPIKPSICERILKKLGI